MLPNNEQEELDLKTTTNLAKVCFGAVPGDLALKISTVVGLVAEPPRTETRPPMAGQQADRFDVFEAPFFDIASQKLMLERHHARREMCGICEGG